MTAYCLIHGRIEETHVGVVRRPACNKEVTAFPPLAAKAEAGQPTLVSRGRDAVASSRTISGPSAGS